MRRKTMKLLAVSAALVGGVQSGFAGELTTTMTVQVNVIDACTSLFSGFLDFGTVPAATGQTVNQFTSIEVQCTNGTPFQVGMDNGQSASGERRMQSFSDPGLPELPYDIFRDSAATQRWGAVSTPDAFVGTGNGTSQTILVFGQVVVSPGTTPSSYNDSVTITLSF
jgi:spore coat protein U-like protein